MLQSNVGKLARVEWSRAGNGETIESPSSHNARIRLVIRVLYDKWWWIIIRDNESLLCHLIKSDDGSLLDSLMTSNNGSLLGHWIMSDDESLLEYLIMRDDDDEVHFY